MSPALSKPKREELILTEWRIQEDIKLLSNSRVSSLVMEMLLSSRRLVEIWLYRSRTRSWSIIRISMLLHNRSRILLFQLRSHTMVMLTIHLSSRSKISSKSFNSKKTSTSCIKSSLILVLMLLLKLKRQKIKKIIIQMRHLFTCCAKIIRIATDWIRLKPFQERNRQRETSLTPNPTNLTLHLI